MKRIRRGIRYAAEIITAAVMHYWLTLTVGILLQAAAIIYASAERGYYAIGSEIIVLPVVALIGYCLTPILEVEITDRGLKFYKREH